MITDEQHQQPELLVGPWRQSPLRRKQSDIARHIAPAKKVEQRCTKRVLHEAGPAYCLPLSVAKRMMAMMTPTTSTTTLRAVDLSWTTPAYTGAPGNPKQKAEFDYIRSYCPYTNLAARDYPAMLVKTSRLAASRKSSVDGIRALVGRSSPGGAMSRVRSTSV